jgi:hypothetical protein
LGQIVELNQALARSGRAAWRLRQVLLASAAAVVICGLAVPADAKPPVAIRPVPARDFGPLPKGPLQLVVSISSQRVTLYSNGVHVAQGPVSTGMEGHATPMGVFSVIQKDRYHHSNLYSNAPMPYMQRITWSGVALHEGPLPGFAASHGCIRLTHEFAAKLWLTTSIGVRVIVARNDIVPVAFSHPRLFVPKDKSEDPAMGSNEPEKHVAAPSLVRVAQAATGTSNDGGGIAAPTLEPQPAPAVEAVPIVPPTDSPAAKSETPDNVAATPGAVPAPDVATAPAEAPAKAAPPFKIAPLIAPATVPPAAAEPVKVPPPPKPRVAQPAGHAGEVAVFISRREKKLYVRRGFVPLFDVPVEIDHPDQPLGTHVFTALSYTDDGAAMRWNVMSMAGDPPRAAAPKKKGQQPVEAPVPHTAAQALDRIQIPPVAMNRIGEILTPGSSLVISDQGLGDETGQGTDFVVLTH